MSRIELKRHLMLSISVILFVLFGSGCTYFSAEPENILILSAEPMGHTAISYYLPLSTVYDSDKHIFLIAQWGENVESANHTMRWEIHDKKGKKIYSSTRKDFNVRANMYTVRPIALKELLKESQYPDQLTAHFFIDDKLIKSMQIAYKNESIAGNSDQMLIILPFIEENDYPTPWFDDIRMMFQNTAADAIYCETSRIFPETLPHYVVEQKVGRNLDPNCLKDKACASFLKDSFGENIYIYGNLSIQKADLDASTLTVYVYDMKTDRLKRFHFFQRYNYTYASLMQDLLKGVFYERGMLEYLRDLSAGIHDQTARSITAREKQEEDAALR